jgi:transposase-like protein
MRDLSLLRQQAINLRKQHNLALDEIAGRLGLHRSTIYYWIRDIPLTRTERTLRQTSAQQAGTLANQAKCASRRQQAYSDTYNRAHVLLKDQQIRDFVVLYLAEGYRRNRNSVAFSNSNPVMVRFAHDCIQRLATNRHIRYSFQYHADQDPIALQSFWGSNLNIDPERIKPIRKTNSGHLKSRRFNCEWGVLQIQVSDTTFRAQLQALMDVVQKQWSSAEAELADNIESSTAW